MRPCPPDWPRISSALYYEDAHAAIAWLCAAFGFEIRLVVEGDGGRVEHSELTFGEGVIMVGDGSKSEKFPYMRAPATVGGANTQNMLVYVDDVDAHCARARAHGARVTTEPKTTDYGVDYWTDRTYECVDVGGHHWWFAQRLRNAGEAT